MEGVIAAGNTTSKQGKDSFYTDCSVSFTCACYNCCCIKHERAVNLVYMEHYSSRINLVKCRHIVRLFQGERVNNLRSIGNSDLFEGTSYLKCVTYSRKYGIHIFF